MNWDSTIHPRISLVRRLARFTDEYPWRWDPAEVEAFFDYITDTRYGWPSTFNELFGRAPGQLLHEWNTITHTSEYEGAAERRPLTYDEVQTLCDAADGRVEEIRARRRKGSLAALRDAMVLKTVYAFGLRRQEACGLDLCDLRRNPRVADCGRFGAIFVRYGKASKGGPPKCRSVLTVPEMDWIVGVLDQYVSEVRPAFVPGKHPAFWITERRDRMSSRRLSSAFDAARQSAGLPVELDLHSLRHSYVTHLIEFGYPEKFVQDQVGHAYASTTAIHSPLDRIRQAGLPRLHRVPHADLTAPPGGGHDLEGPPRDGGGYSNSAHSSTNAQSRRMRLKKKGVGSKSPFM